MAVEPARLSAALAEVGLASFRPLQREAISCVLNKRDCVVVVATGADLLMLNSQACVCACLSRLFMMLRGTNSSYPDHNDFRDCELAGGGKSLCFQLPCLIQQAISIIITPLISLAKDQVRHTEQY